MDWVTNFEEIRKFSYLFGNFSESIKPHMIHSILSWLKKTSPKYKFIKPQKKVFIIHNLKELGIVIDANFFITIY